GGSGGFFTDAAVKQALTRGVLTSEGQTVCYASGTFVVLPPPLGVKLAALPWQRRGKPGAQPLEPHELNANEHAIVRAADTALAQRDSKHTFIEHFWGILPKHTAKGTACRLQIGPQIGNRAGHVQGGIL